MLDGVQIDIYIQADSSLNSVGGGVENVALLQSVGFILSMSYFLFTMS